MQFFWPNQKIRVEGSAPSSGPIIYNRGETGQTVKVNFPAPVSETGGCQPQSEETDEGGAALPDRKCDSNKTFQSVAAATPKNKPPACYPTLSVCLPPRDGVDRPVNKQP